MYHFPAQDIRLTSPTPSLYTFPKTLFSSLVPVSDLLVLDTPGMWWPVLDFPAVLPDHPVLAVACALGNQHFLADFPPCI